MGIAYFSGRGKKPSAAPIVKKLKPGVEFRYDNGYFEVYKILSLENNLFKFNLTENSAKEVRIGFIKRFRKKISERIFFIDKEGMEYDENKKPLNRHTKLWINPNKIRIGNVVPIYPFSYYVASVKKVEHRNCYYLVHHNGTLREESYYDKDTGLLLMEILRDIDPLSKKLGLETIISKRKLTYTNITLS